MTQYKICKNIIGYEDAIKLDLNEFDFDHHPDIYKIINENVIKPKSITHYSNVYNTNTTYLLKHISNYNDISINQILLSAGSDDSLEYIINKYITKDVHVIVFVPSYNYFEVLIKRHTQNIHYIPIDFADNQYNIDDCLEFYKDILDNAVIYIVNPNNPLGTLFCKDSLERQINLYKKTIFIIDEAYIEFVKNETCVQLTKKYENVIITRTFSKAYGLAGVRLGYLIAHEKTLQNIKVLYNEKNTTDLSKAAGIAIFNNIEYYENIINDVNDIKEDLYEFFDENNIYNVKSSANFISFYIGKNVDLLLKNLEANNIFIRNRDTQFNMSGFARITIGQREHINKFKVIISKYVHLFDTKPLIKHYSNKLHIWKLKLLFKKVVDILNKKQINYWADSGTLLGIFRHNGIIPWDNDIDIGILDKDTQKLIDLTNEFKQNGLRLKLNRTNCYYQIDTIDTSSDELTRPIHIDIFPFKENEISCNELLNVDNRFINNDKLRCNFRYNKDDLFPLKPYKFYNILDIFIPNNVENILTTNILSDYKKIAYVSDEHIYPITMLRSQFA